ncbi:MAG: hypothetical protein HY039_03715 [Nitrospirae bacterium]|nr:hypothetical protein [Nitrospirota bacterium]
MRYIVRFTEEARTHLRQLSAGERKRAVERVEVVLGNQPTRITRNVKLLRPNPLAHYEAFMSYLDGIGERARRGRTYSLEEIRSEFGLGSPLSKPRKPRGLRGIRIKGEPMSETIIKARG